MPLTNAEKQKAHRRRMAEKMARYERALERISRMAYPDAAIEAYLALNPTGHAKS